MKFCAIAALLGYSNAITLWTLNGKVAYTDDEYENNELVQLEGDDDDKPTEYFHAGEHGQLGAKEYERVVPARFASDDDDIFMRSMIQ